MAIYKYIIRAHHGMCLAYFKGIGYSDDFSENMQKIKNSIEENPLIKISACADDICKKCPNNIKGICKTQEKVINYDKLVLSLCNLEENAVLPFRDFEDIVLKNIILSDKRKEICADCQWNDICTL